MSILDTLKTKLAPAREKVSDFAQHHGGKIEHGLEKVEHGLEKAARSVDHRTKGKYSDKIESGTGKAKEALGRLAPKEGGTPKDDGTPPPPTAS